MRYIKTFEKIGKPKFKVGDLVFINRSYYDSFPDHRKEVRPFGSNLIPLIYYQENTISEIIKIMPKAEIDPTNSSDYFYDLYFEDFPYELMMQYGGGQNTIINIVENDIRFATPEEIEEYMMKKTAKKYNL